MNMHLFVIGALSSFDGYVYARLHAMVICLIAAMFGFRHDLFTTLDVMR